MLLIIHSSEQIGFDLIDFSAQLNWVHGMWKTSYGIWVTSRKGIQPSSGRQRS